MNRLYLMSGLLAIALMARASEPDSLRTATLNPVVVTGTGTYHRAATSPVSVRVVSAKDLRDAHATSLQEALSRLTPNITTHTSGMGTFVNFNGVSDDYIVILVNGQRVSGDDRWDRISLDDVRRIEIYNGAASVLYGSDAMAGVINIITDDSRKPVAASTTTKVMNHGRFTEDINVDATVGHFTTRTSYTHRQADNWQVNHYQAFDEDGTEVLKLTGRPMSTGFHSDNISERLEWRFDDRWSVYLRGSYYDNLTTRPQSATYFTQKKTATPSSSSSVASPSSLAAAPSSPSSQPAPSSSPSKASSPVAAVPDGSPSGSSYTYTSKAAYTYDLHHRSYTYGGGARFAPNSRVHLYLDVYSDNFSSTYDYWQTADKEAYDETRKRTHYVNETLRGIFRLARWNKLTAGAEFVQESLTSQSDNIDFETTNTYNLFLQDEVNIVKGLDAFAALRYTQNDNFGAALTPNVGLFYHVSFPASSPEGNNSIRLRASYAGGYRTPTLSQLYATDQAKTTARYTLPNPGLNPEKNHYINASAEYANAWMTLSVNAFWNKIRDMINYRTLSAAEIAADPALTALQAEGWQTIRRRDNIDRATLRGFSTQLRLLLPYGITLGGGYTLTDSKAETQTGGSVTTSPVDKSVRHVGNILATWDRAWGNYRLNVTIDGHLQGRRYSSTYGYADGYGQWNIATRHTITLRNCTLEPGIGIDNIFNQRDTSPWNSNFSTVNPGRSYVATLRLTY